MQIGAPQVLKLIALGLGLAAALAALVELSRSTGYDRAAPAAEADPLRATLERCRDLAPEDYESATDCRAAWEASRRRFFGLPSAVDATPGADPAGRE
ncbi:MAG: putative entry exclusion protein TrbK-alt [Alkalilacustris sp.]